MTEAYKNLKLELHKELLNILQYWETHTIDEEHGGFVGKIDFFNNHVPKASKGIILNTRILWAFSASANHLNTEKYRTLCDQSFAYIQTYFKDTYHKGVFWEVDFTGKPINKRKQIYAQVFTIYALSEYYITTKNESAKSWAIDLFNTIEKYAKDTLHGGYFEAFHEDWSPIKDMRLSKKDLNASKTMNTHLHILEAYTSLLKIHDSIEVKKALRSLIHLLFDKFLNVDYNFELFFDDQWKLLSHSISYGHDIEAAWLIIEAAKAVDDSNLIKKANSIAIQIADNFLATALHKNGAVLNEKNRKTNEIDTDLHWWPQVEAMIGLDYAYQLTQHQKYIEASLKIWSYTKKHIIDHTHGEWYFRVDENNNPYTIEDKVSMWKAPYHNARACIVLNTQTS
ncbi:AGE family epimerase/isomerase [uncultured Kordia sp.]|uniref:AGE family epimerase/isomerase n=1 Tax=uncultured Kordia sp. TaxID=507699 RepID=UPI002630EA0D|nr:AGE family epimerase/isomerase [uncultured Kordia sp.]